MGAAAQSVAVVTPDGQPPVNDAQLKSLAVGAMLGELQASVDEFRANGWHQVGKPTIPFVRVGPLVSPGLTIQLEACLDSSSVKVVDEAGNDVAAGNKIGRALNVYTLVRDSPQAEWKVSSRSFPDDATC